MIPYERENRILCARAREVLRRLPPGALALVRAAGVRVTVVDDEECKAWTGNARHIAYAICQADGTWRVLLNRALAAPTPRAISLSSPHYTSYTDISGTAPDDLPDSGDGSTGWNTIVWYA